MSKQTEHALVPKLRFPEFRGNWTTNKLGELGKLIGGGTPDKSVSEYWQGEIPWVSSSDIFDDDIHKIQITRYINEKSISESATKIVPKGSVLFVSRVGTGKLAINDKEVCTSQDFTNFIPDKIHNYFLGYFFAANKSALTSLDQGTSIKGFSKSDLEKFELSYPCESEQQKIADCLSSIDELITAQTQQLDGLKTHKNGLMQQLFPAEGETIPKLRFPEFRDARDWEEIKLINVADKKIKWSFIGGPFGSNLKSSDYVADGIRIIQLQNIGDAKFFDHYKIFTSEEKADELLANNIYPGEIILSKMGDPVGRACLIPHRHTRYVMCSDGIRLVVDEKVFSKYFIYTLINSIQFRTLIEKTATGSTRKRIGLDDLKNLPMVVPKKQEQQKIADCLSSIDELITAQSQKIDALKAHKKGLMQQLFPVVDEVNG